MAPKVKPQTAVEANAPPAMATARKYAGRSTRMNSISSSATEPAMVTLAKKLAARKTMFKRYTT